MKELSIKEKAERYDEAIKKAKDYHKQLLDEDNPEWASEIEKMFPELTEKKDEKVEEAIFEMVYDSDNVLWSSYGVSKSDVLAWLEKQSELKPTWSEEDELHIRELESLVKQVWAKAERENDKDKIHKMSNLSFFLKTLKPQLKSVV